MDDYCTQEIVLELIERVKHTNGLEFASDAALGRLHKMLAAELAERASTEMHARFMPLEAI